MKKLANEIGKLWRRLARFFESGDLVPFYVIISVAHYIPVLANHDSGPIAALVGMAVDMLHFRAVRAWFNGRIWSFHAVIGVMTTVMASAYHWRFYDGDLLLALPIPVGIAILAYQMSDSDNNRKFVDGLKAERDTVVMEYKAVLLRLDTIEQQAATLSAERDTAVSERDAALVEVAKQRRQLDKGVIRLDKLPSRLADYVTAVSNGVTPDGDFTQKYGVGKSTLDRANSMFLAGDK